MSTVMEPARSVPVRWEVDVAVCGAGPAGVCAALAAARLGASVALVERHAFAGGVNTAAGVNGIGGWQYELDGTPLIRGIPLELMAAVAAAGGADPALVARLSRPRPGGPDYRDGGLGCYWIATSPEAVKRACDNLLEAAGVRLLYHAAAVAPLLADGAVRGVFVESKSGRECIRARCVVDCTGDGDVAARAGAPFAIGRPGDGACQPMTAIFTVGRADLGDLWYGADEADPEPDPLVRGRYRGAIAAARAAGTFRRNPNDVLCAATPPDRADRALRMVNFTRVQRLSAIDAGELTAAEIEGRRQVAEAVDFMRGNVRGCAQAWLVSTPPQIGIRESRRILGEHVLTGDEVRAGTGFADAVARGIYLLDIHNPTEVGRPSALILLDRPYSIPLRCLVPRGIDGLLTAGRCISGDHEALASFRVMSHCMATGQAAGAAAALARDGRPRALAAAAVRAALATLGANVGP